MSFVVIGSGLIALVVGLIVIGTARYTDREVPRYGIVLASAAAPLMLLGLLVGDAARVADPVGAAVLVASLMGLVVFLSLPVLTRVRGEGSTARAAAFGLAALLLLVFLVWLGITTADLLSLLIVFGLAALVVGVVGAVIGALWLVIQLFRRQARPAAAFTWSAASLAIIGLVGVAVLTSDPPPVPDSFTSSAELDEFLQEYVDNGGPPGISLVVVKDGEMVYNKAFGLADGPNAVPTTPDTIYHWFSVTKIPTAIAAMRLVEQGVIDLDDEVSDYLPFFEVNYPSVDSQRVTVAHLLNHSSGLPDDMPACMGCVHLDDEPALDQTDLLQQMKLPRYNTLDFEPGSDAVYTNVGYHTLGAVVEEVTGQSYEDYVVDHILEPLGMVNTRFEYTEAMRGDAAVGAHPLTDFQSIFLPIIDPPWPSSYIRDYDNGWAWFNRFLFDANPPSGLIGPAPEMARLVAALLNGGKFDGARILSEETVEAMFTERHLLHGSSQQWGEYDRFGAWEQGLGWKVIDDDERLHYAHGGGGAAFKAFMRLYPAENLGIVILVNGTNVDRQEIADAVADMDW
jgi:CubicO group peptidase (beta-lactamase class C family)